MELTDGFAELIGALIGDGHTYRKNGKYQIGFVGNPINDLEYFKRLQQLIKQEWQKDSKLSFRERGVRLVINSKEICDFILDELNIPTGGIKCEKVIIPGIIASNPLLVNHVLRGIVDTDGSVFVSKKPGIAKYPSIEITTSSKDLANQIRTFLIQKGFRVAKIWDYKSKLSKRTTYKVPLNGKFNLKKWIDEIGFSNPYKLRRALSYLE